MEIGQRKGSVRIIDVIIDRRACLMWCGSKQRLVSLLKHFEFNGVFFIN